MIFTSCNKQKSSEDFGKNPTINTESQNAEALALFKQKCYACHSVITKSHDEIIAPPMIAVKKRYSMQYDNKEDFVNAIVAYASNPKAENALMIGAVNQFKAMPKQAFFEEARKNGFNPVELGKVIIEKEVKIPLYGKMISIDTAFIRNLPMESKGDVNHYLKSLLEYDSQLKNAPNPNFTTN